MRRDLEQLGLLAAFHYVLAGVVALTSSIPIIHVLLGLGILIGALPARGPGASVVGLFFVVVGSAAILLGWAFAVLLAVAGRSLQVHRRHAFCFVIACLSCLLAPLGTALGVCSILVLSRPRVKDLFAGRLLPHDPGEAEGDRAPPARRGGEDRVRRAD
jgi:hypothetical protein